MFLLACLYECKKMLNKNFVCSPKNKNVLQNFSQGDKLSLSDQILAQIPFTENAGIVTANEWSEIANAFINACCMRAFQYTGNFKMFTLQQII